MMTRITLKKLFVAILSMVLCLAYGIQSLSCVCVPSKPLSCSSEDENAASACGGGSCSEEPVPSKKQKQDNWASACCSSTKKISPVSLKPGTRFHSQKLANSQSREQTNHQETRGANQACTNPCVCVPVVVETKREIPLLHKNLSDDYRDSHTSVLSAGVSSIAFLKNQYQIIRGPLSINPFPTHGGDMNAALCVWLC